MITWFYGNTGAGKTTRAKALARQVNAILLDGDELREVWSLGFTESDRREQNQRVYRLAKLLERQGFDVVVALICPYKDQREGFTGVNFIYVDGGKVGKGYPFEV